MLGTGRRLARGRNALRRTRTAILPRGHIRVTSRGDQESVDDLLVGTTENRCGFIQAKRAIDFSEKVDSDFGSVIDQMVRQVVDKPADGVRRPWTRELTPANDRLLLVTSSRSSEKIKVHLRGVSAPSRLRKGSR